MPQILSAQKSDFLPNREKSQKGEDLQLCIVWEARVICFFAH